MAYDKKWKQADKLNCNVAMQHGPGGPYKLKESQWRVSTGEKAPSKSYTYGFGHKKKGK